MWGASWRPLSGESRLWRPLRPREAWGQADAARSARTQQTITNYIKMLGASANMRADRSKMTRQLESVHAHEKAQSEVERVGGHALDWTSEQYTDA
jgi:hypothetical protein